MSQLSKNDKNMINDQAVIRWVYPTKAAEWLSHLMEIPLRTARHWADQAVPVYRREELGRRLLEEYDRREKYGREHIRPMIVKMAGLGDEVKIGTAATLAFAAADFVEHVQHQVDAAIDRLEADECQAVNGRSRHKFKSWW